MMRSSRNAGRLKFLRLEITRLRSVESLSLVLPSMRTNSRSSEMPKFESFEVFNYKEN